jgi:hypothetical protein
MDRLREMSYTEAVREIEATYGLKEEVTWRLFINQSLLRRRSWPMYTQEEALL